MPKQQPGTNPDQETRNDDPNVQEQRERKARGERDQAEGEREENEVGADERIPGADDPRGDRVHDAREARRPGGGRKGQPL